MVAGRDKKRFKELTDEGVSVMAEVQSLNHENTEIKITKFLTGLFVHPEF
jgi:hypothetical protein